MVENNESLYNKVISKWNDVKNHSPDVKYFTSSLEKMPNTRVGIFGGAVRDWWLDKTPKDIDLVIDTTESALVRLLDNFGTQKNGFDGNMITIDGIIFDFWVLKDTYAFRTGQFLPSWENLVKSVPFSTDTVVVLLDGPVFTYNFWEALTTKEISFVNKTIREPKRIANRAIAQCDKYGFTMTAELAEYVKQHIDLLDVSELVGSSNKYLNLSTVDKAVKRANKINFNISSAVKIYSSN